MTLSLGRGATAAPPPSPRETTNWDRAAFAVAALVASPLLAIAWLAAGADGGGLAHAARFILPTAFRETALLAAGVLLIAVPLGVAAGWLIASFDFPGRRLLGWGLVLPFAVPTYIAAYAYVEAFDYFGPLQGLFRWLTGYRARSAYWFPEIRSLGGAAFVTAMVLYPYVYVASRAAFAMQGADLHDAARSLGCSRLEALWRAVLPALAPMVAAGATLVVLETLNDIGASQYLGVNTLTVAIYSTWLNKGDLGGAAQIALSALGCVMALLWLERALRNNRRFAMPSRGGRRPAARRRLSGWRGALAAVSAATPVMLGFVLPAGILLGAAWRQWRSEGLPSDMTQALGNSLLAATLATAAILAIAAVLAFARRFTRRPTTGLAVRFSGLGYAVPGTVLVIGLLPALGLVDRLANDLVIALGGQRMGLLLSGSVAAIVLAYTIRFLAIGLEQCDAGLASLSRNTDYAARTLGCSENRVAWRILAPALRPALAGAAVLVFVDCLKELPATLLLRPLNFETLATQLYGHAARGSFEDGAVAALLIVAAGLLPLVLMNAAMDRR
jgi:iron(III) transport system permease protein